MDYDLKIGHEEKRPKLADNASDKQFLKAYEDRITDQTIVECYTPIDLIKCLNSGNPLFLGYDFADASKNIINNALYKKTNYYVIYDSDTDTYYFFHILLGSNEKKLICDDQINDYYKAMNNCLNSEKYKALNDSPFTKYIDSKAFSLDYATPTDIFKESAEKEITHICKNCGEPFETTDLNSDVCPGCSVHLEQLKEASQKNLTEDEIFNPDEPYSEESPDYEFYNYLDSLEDVFENSEDSDETSSETIEEIEELPFK